jgi:hypothetical protein
MPQLTRFDILNFVFSHPTSIPRKKSKSLKLKIKKEALLNKFIFENFQLLSNKNQNYLRPNGINHYASLIISKK